MDCRVLLYSDFVAIACRFIYKLLEDSRFFVSKEQISSTFLKRLKYIVKKSRKNP